MRLSPPPCGCHPGLSPQLLTPDGGGSDHKPPEPPSSLTSLSGGTAVLGSQCPSRPRGPARLPSSTPTLAPRPHSPEVLTAARTSGRAWRVSVCSWPQQHAGSLRPGERFRSEATPSPRGRSLKASAPKCTCCTVSSQAPVTTPASVLWGPPGPLGRSPLSAAVQ